MNKGFSATDGRVEYNHGEQKIIKADRLGSSIFCQEGSSARFLFKLRQTKERNGPFNMKKIAVIMGSDSDLPVVEKAINTLSEYGVPYEVHVFSAHRTPEEARAFSSSARKNGFGAIIAAAGMAAHLAGALAANTTLPVIGIPVKSKYLDGIDALLSTVQMPSGIPVATVAIDGAVNAALLSIQMLAIEDATLAEKLDAARRAGSEKVLSKNAELEARFNH